MSGWTRENPVPNSAPNNANPTISALSRLHLTPDEFDALIAQHLAWTQRHYPWIHFTQEENDFWITRWGAIARQVGLIVFGKAVEACTNKCKLFPSVAEIWEQIDALPVPPDNRDFEAFERHKRAVQAYRQSPEYEADMIEYKKALDALEEKVRAYGVKAQKRSA